MWTHENIWYAIDRLAASFGYSSSGLAKQAGLDPTSFNKSKRFSSDGKPRWPSTESISRVLVATGAQMSDFLSLMDDKSDAGIALGGHAIPLIGFAQAGAKGYFDEDGYPVGDAWDEIKFPEADAKEQGSYALEISGDSMEPLYRKGDVLVLSRDSKIHKGDRVVVRTSSGEVMVKELANKSGGKIELKSLNPKHETRILSTDEVSWMARVLWVSQ